MMGTSRECSDRSARESRRVLCTSCPASSQPGQLCQMHAGLLRASLGLRRHLSVFGVESGPLLPP